MIRKCEDVRTRGNHGVPDPTARSIKAYVAKMFGELMMCEQFFDLERQAFLCAMGDKGAMLLQTRVSGLVFPDVAKAEVPKSVRAVLQLVVRAHASPLTNFVPEASKTELSDFRDILQEMVQGDAPTFEKRPTKVRGKTYR